VTPFTIFSFVRGERMRAFRRPLTVVVAATALAVGITSGIYAQGSDWKAPADAKSTKNPLAAKKSDAKLLADAKKLAEQNCATCHGPGGKGDGPAAAALPPPKPADWTSAKLAAETDGELFWKMSNGRGAMPPWKHLPEDQRWSLVNYIRSLQAKK
jgi:mono/diheme cytochrome c family protein